MLINKECSTKALSNNILSLATDAANAKGKNPSVINATIGMFNGEDNSFYTFESVKEALEKVSAQDAFAYSDTDGGEAFKKSVLKWVFDSYLDSFLDNYHVEVCATNGGSGAIATSFQNYLKQNEKVLVPSVMWETYITMAKERGSDVLKYELYDSEGNFNLNSIKKELDELAKSQETIILVINDPCHNPTGFCMEEEDYNNLVNLLNEYKLPILLMMDIAYFDFYDDDRAIIRHRFSLLNKLNSNISINFIFSGSKSFGLYGLRIGANILFTQDEKEAKWFKNAIEYSCRNNWGSSSRLGISIITKLISNDDLCNNFKEETKKVSSMLKERSEAFIQEAKKVGLVTLPYKRGFFICVPFDNPVQLMNKLHEHDVYVVVTKTCIRIALCAISKEEAKKLPQIILKTINELRG